ncbi:MAG: N-acyl homoserine lactonase family protein [Vicinamibacterales bacterium]
MRISPSVARRLFVLDFGRFRVRDDGRTIGIQGFLLELATGERVLVDSGFPPWYHADPPAASRRDGLDAFGTIVDLTSEHTPPAQLAKAGVSPDAVSHFFLTHSDIDHVGDAATFGGATLIVGRAERALERPRYFGESRPLAWPAVRDVILVDCDTELWPGVTALATPGHSPGHLSLMVDLPTTGTVIAAADAISRPSQLVDGFTDAWDAELARAHAARLMTLARERDAFVIFGHDPRQWLTVRKAPAFYD